MIDAKLKGEGIEDEETEEPDRGNVVDLMAALKKSLGGEGSGKPTRVPKAKAKAEPVAKTSKQKGVAAASAPKPARKRA